MKRFIIPFIVAIALGVAIIAVISTSDANAAAFIDRQVLHYTGTDAADVAVTARGKKLVYEVFIAVEDIPNTGVVTMGLDCYAGAAYDRTVTADLGNLGIKEYSFPISEGGLCLERGDVLSVGYTNEGNATYGITIVTSN